MTDRSKQKRLLALDGGGLMGLISLGILTKVEADLKKAHGDDPDFRLSHYFDYIGGTSTGAIIAAGLTTGRTVQDLIDIYMNHGAKMFTPASLWAKVSSVFSHKYDNTFLSDMLKQEFTDKSIQELQENPDIPENRRLPKDKHLLMVTRNYKTDSAWPISTNPNALFNSGDLDNRKLPLWQVIRASTAAPSFFQPEWIRVPGDTEDTPFVDGGLTPHNNPAMKMFEMATRPEYRCGWFDADNPPSEENLMILSIGTGFSDRVVREPKRSGQPLTSLAMTTPSDLMHGINTAIDVACRSLGRCRYGHKIDYELGTMMDRGSLNPAFAYARHTIDVSPDNLTKLGIRNDGAKLVMDSVDQMPIFLEAGMKASENVDMQAHFPDFL